MKRRVIQIKLVCVVLIVYLSAFCYISASPSQSPEIIPVEIFHIHQLPVTVSNAELVKSSNSYQFRSSISNNSDEKLLGFRYSLVAIDSNNAKTSLANRSEALVLASYTSKRRTFRTPLTINLKDDVRLVLMLEQIVGSESIWEVVKAKDALQAYAAGDFSVVPVVLRVPNHVDVPPQQQRVIY